MKPKIKNKKEEKMHEKLFEQFLKSIPLFSLIFLMKTQF